MFTYRHHQETAERVVAFFQSQPEVQALLLGGSIAHGFEQPTSDVDVMIIVPDEAYQRRVASGELQFFSVDLSTFEGGYVDGKYLSLAFLSQVEACGSEPARFAFAAARILLSHVGRLQDRLDRIARYPVEDKASRIARFHAQFQAWHWYVGEAVKKQDDYLLGVAISKLLLFGGRMILAHNERLYPFHKWFLKVLEHAEHKPEGVLDIMKRLARTRDPDVASEFFKVVDTYRTWEQDGVPWPHRFMLDTEWTWMNGSAPVDDI
jgi:predicted nucleotidyltransferase